MIVRPSLGSCTHNPLKRVKPVSHSVHVPLIWKVRQAGPMVTHSPLEMNCLSWQTKLAPSDEGAWVGLGEAMLEGMQYL